MNMVSAFIFSAIVVIAQISNNPVDLPDSVEGGMLTDEEVSIYSSLLERKARNLQEQVDAKQNDIERASQYDFGALAQKDILGAHLALITSTVEGEVSLDGIRAETLKKAVTCEIEGSGADFNPPVSSLFSVTITLYLNRDAELLQMRIEHNIPMDKTPRVQLFRGERSTTGAAVSPMYLLEKEGSVLPFTESQRVQRKFYQGLYAIVATDNNPNGEFRVNLECK